MRGVGSTLTRNGATYVRGPGGIIKFPVSANSAKRRVAWLLRQGYVWTAYLFAKHANKVLVGLLQRTHPNTPWKNLQFAAKYA